MTYQVKEGDVLEYRGDGRLTSAFSFEKGKVYKVENGGDYLFIRSECGERAWGCLNYWEAFGFHLVTTPPATIQHEGYNYTRGEPVVPEWIKDGAWVVHKKEGEIGQVGSDIYGHCIFLPLNKKFRDCVGNALILEHYRPFTNEDWKWGMWAEYKGEKVFVMSGKDGGGVFASRPTNTYFFALFSEITPTTAP